ncbi:MAG TPA: phosphotransferase [Steroidobacteraceae bacterium]|nr:phosphotransferase [Steroidobacteraceae bacterium]
MPENDARLALLQGWLARDLGLRPARIEPASSDASFRRYFRAFCDERTVIVMDAPPPTEDVRPYLHVTALLEPLGIHVPHVYEADVARGFVLLEDLGSTHYLAALGAGGDSQRLYADALRALADIQLRGAAAAAELSPYDRAPLARELAEMPEWFLERHLALELTGGEREMIAAAFEFLIAEALSQPEVFVHRDYHSRNLMVVGERNPGVIDFQDALRGPIGYDLVSLLKDCYICWPRERVVEWVSGYRSLLQSRGAMMSGGPAQFLRWFDLIGAQRHIKVLGRFARLWYRDGKPGYLRDLPLTLGYVRETCRLYPELAQMAEFLERRVAPELPRANERVARQAARPA